MQAPPMLPIDVSEIILSVMGMLVVLIPITGLTARFALKPIVEAIARLRETGTTNQAVLMLERRMDLLEQEVQSVTALREDIAKLVEAQEFHLKLSAGQHQPSRGE